MMTISRVVALAALSLLPAPLFAGDGDKPAVTAPPVIVKEEPKAKSECRSRGFVGFWVHTVGGTIGNGLKSGARKIDRAFK